MIRATGEAPEGMHAHHILPKKFKEKFEEVGININNPKYGMWLSPNEHLSNGKAYWYNKGWEDFLKGEYSVENIEGRARLLMQEIYGKTISF